TRAPGYRVGNTWSRNASPVALRPIVHKTAGHPRLASPLTIVRGDSRRFESRCNHTADPRKQLGARTLARLDPRGTPLASYLRVGFHPTSAEGSMWTDAAPCRSGFDQPPSSVPRNRDRNEVPNNAQHAVPGSQAARSR